MRFGATLRKGHAAPVADDAGATPGLVAAALWLTFVGTSLRPLVKDVALLRNGARFLGEIGALFLIAAGVFWLIRQRPDPARNTARLWTLVMLAVSLPPAIAGLAFGNRFVLWSHLGLFPFATAAAIWLGTQRVVWDRILKVLSTQVIIGAAYAALVLLLDPPHDRVEWNGEDGIGLAKHATRSMYAMPFLLPLLDRMSHVRAVGVVLAYLLFLAMAIAGANRGQLTVGALVLPALLVAVSLRGPSKAARQLGKLTLVTASAIALLALVSGRGATYANYFEHRWEELASRLTGGQQEASAGTAGRAALATSQEEFSGEESRGGEVRAFFNQLTPVDWVAGRGWGGTWYSSYWRMDWNMVHIGPAHLVLEGGLPLMVAFLALMVHALYAAWKGAARWPAAAGALGAMLSFSIAFLQHGAISDDIEVYFFWLCVGAAFAHRAIWRAVDDAPAPARAESPRARLLAPRSAP